MTNSSIEFTDKKGFWGISSYYDYKPSNNYPSIKLNLENNCKISVTNEVNNSMQLLSPQTVAVYLDNHVYEFIKKSLCMPYCYFNVPNMDNFEEDFKKYVSFSKINNLSLKNNLPFFHDDMLDFECMPIESHFNSKNSKIFQYKKTIFSDNIDIHYDIDAIIFMCDIETVHGLKNDIFVDYKYNNTYSNILNTSLIIKSKKGFSQIKNLFAIEISKVHFICHKPGKLFLLTSIDNNDSENITTCKNEFHLALLEMIASYENYTTRDCFMFKHKWKFSLEGDQYSKSYFFNGQVTTNFLSSLLRRVNNSKIEYIYYFEQFDLKDFIYTEDTELCDIDLSKYFDLDILIPRVDFCFNVNFKNNTSYTISIDNSFISSPENVTEYSIFNSNTFLNFSETTVKSSKLQSIQPKILPKVRGIFKINFYSPIIYDLFEYSHRKNYFQTHTCAKLAQSCYGYTSKNVKKFNEKKLINSLKLGITNSKNKVTHNYGIRLEISTLLFNIPVYTQNILESINNNFVYLTHTETLIGYIILPFLEKLVDILNNQSQEFKKTIEFVGLIALYETIGFNFFIRGNRIFIHYHRESHIL